MSRTSLALSYARASAIFLVVGVHATLAYLQFPPHGGGPFANPPYDWRVIPIIDPRHWIGFDLFCALQFVVLMPFMFFLSGLFVCPSLTRKGARTFFRDRLLRIGVPFAIGVYLLMPVAYYPVYRLAASDPTWSEFWAQWNALPFSPSGPLWFLWHILVFDIAAAALFSLSPRAGQWLARWSGAAADRPGRYCIALGTATALAYVPLAAIFRPWALGQIGPFVWFPSRFLYFAVYFFAGVGIGTHAIDRGLLRSDGLLPRRWAFWSALALATFGAWLLLAALTADSTPLGFGPIRHLDIVANLVFALASAVGCLAFAAIFLRFAKRPRALAQNVADNAYGIYLIHYVFVVWLQYLLFDLALFAVAKAAIVVAGAFLAGWGVSNASRRTAVGALVMGVGRRARPATARDHSGSVPGSADARAARPIRIASPR